MSKEFKTDVNIDGDLSADNIVYNDTNQTVYDVKTFDQSPIVPTPTTDFQAAPKKYVDESTELINISAKKWVIFGDSFSANIAANYPLNVINDLKLTGTVTHAVGGNTLKQQLTALDLLLAGDPNYFGNNGFNICSLLIGANDFYNNVDLGTPNDLRTDNTFAGQLKDFIQKVLTSRPEIDLYIITPTNANIAEITYKSATLKGWTFRDMSELMKNIAAQYGVQCIDLNSLAQFNLNTIPNYTTDGLHPNAKGSQVISDIISHAFINRSNKGVTPETTTPNNYYAYDFINRVYADGGIIENVGRLKYDLNKNTKDVLSFTPAAYKTSKLYGVQKTNSLSGTLADFTFTRATSTTRLNNKGLVENVSSNIPVIETENGVTYLRVEPSSTNQIFYSQELDNASWTKLNASVTANQTIAPDGTLTADLFKEDGTNNTHFAYSNIISSSSGNHVLTAYVKAEKRDYIRLSISDMATGNAEARYNVTTGETDFVDVAGVGSWTNISAEMKRLPNGWFRCILKGTQNAGSTINAQLYVSNGNRTYTGDNASGVYFWGVDLKTDKGVTNYIPTTSAAVTRNADAVTLAGSTAVINSVKGVLYAEIGALEDDLSNRHITLSDGTANNVVSIRLSSNTSEITATVTVGGVIQAQIPYYQGSIKTIRGVAIKYEANNFELWIDGQLRGTDVSGTTFSANTLTQLNFHDGAGTNPFYGKLKSLKVFGRTDIDLAALTYGDNYKGNSVVDNIDLKAPIYNPNFIGNASATTFNGVALITGGDDKKFLNELGTYTTAPAAAITVNVQALTSSPADAATAYFGNLPKAPTTTANISKIYFRRAGTINVAEIYNYSGTAGTNEAWSLYVRKNNTTDYLIATVSAATNGRVFSNTALSIPIVSGDYVEIKMVNPTWVTNPLTCIFGGYLILN